PSAALAEGDPGPEPDPGDRPGRRGGDGHRPGSARTVTRLVGQEQHAVRPAAAVVARLGLHRATLLARVRLRGVLESRRPRGHGDRGAALLHPLLFPQRPARDLAERRPGPGRSRAPVAVRPSDPLDGPVRALAQSADFVVPSVLRRLLRYAELRRIARPR